MSKSKIDAAGSGRAHEGLCGKSQFERLVIPFRAMVLGSVGGEEWGISLLFLLRSWDEILKE
jgi:hypothetical protein